MSSLHHFQVHLKFVTTSVFIPPLVKPPLVNKQNVVYKFECDLCDADYIGYTSRHLHQCIDEHRNSAIERHVKEKHGEDAEKIVNCFSVLRKCQGKYDCLLYEMLYIKQHKPSLNTQSDSKLKYLFKQNI